MGCENCGFELHPKWKYCPDCGEVAPESEAEKAARNAKHEARMLTDPDYKAYMDRQAERKKQMQPLLDLHYAVLYAQFVGSTDPLHQRMDKEKT